jgi:metal-responsive CopG/Arc/MetJ family transcriptional regulator
MLYTLIKGVISMSLVNRIRFGSSLDRKLWDKFEQLSKETRIDKSKLLDEAIADLLKKHGKSID